MATLNQTLKDTLFEQTESLYEHMVEMRRDFHMYPELSFQEERTARIIKEYYEKIGLKVKAQVGGNGVVGYLKGGKPGKTIALRADFDALEIPDEKEVPYKSKVPGVSHACGHDIHTAALLATARILNDAKEKIPGNIVFIHQHAEEVAPGGARDMVKDGVLEGVDFVYGAHVESNFPIGEVAVCEGFVNAAADVFQINIQGRGGHGAQPHKTIDSALIGSQLVVDLQQLVSRYIDPLSPALLTVGAINSGYAPNVIADTAQIKGTVRTYEEHTRDEMERVLKRFCKSTADKTLAEINVDYLRGFPALYNDIEETRRVKRVAETIVGSENVKKKDKEMGAEDFAYFVKEVPGTYFWVGGRNPDIDAVYAHHHPKFDVDERSMKLLAKMFIASILEVNEAAQQKNG